MSQYRRLDDILRRLPSGDVVVDDGFAKQAILEVMRGCVPDMKNPIIFGEANSTDVGWSNYYTGWNACCAEMLRRIEEVGK